MVTTSRCQEPPFFEPMSLHYKCITCVDLEMDTYDYHLDEEPLFQDW
jgi:hypothetical protein